MLILIVPDGLALTDAKGRHATVRHHHHLIAIDPSLCLR